MDGQRAASSLQSADIVELQQGIIRRGCAAACVIHQVTRGYRLQMLLMLQIAGSRPAAQTLRRCRKTRRRASTRSGVGDRPNRAPRWMLPPIRAAPPDAAHPAGLAASVVRSMLRLPGAGNQAVCGTAARSDSPLWWCVPAPARSVSACAAVDVVDADAIRRCCRIVRCCCARPRLPDQTA